MFLFQRVELKVCVWNAWECFLSSYGDTTLDCWFCSQLSNLEHDLTWCVSGYFHVNWSLDKAWVYKIQTTDLQLTKNITWNLAPILLPVFWSRTLWDLVYEISQSIPGLVRQSNYSSKLQPFWSRLLFLFSGSIIRIFRKSKWNHSAWSSWWAWACCKSSGELYTPFLMNLVFDEPRFVNEFLD